MEKEFIRKRQYSKFHALMHQLGISDNKADLLAGYGATSTKELTDKDLAHLIKRLMDMLDSRYNASKEVRKYRSIALALLNQYGIYVTNGDWRSVNKFLSNKKVAGKLLYEMSIPEMKALCTKLRSMINKQKKKLAKEKTLSILN